MKRIVAVGNNYENKTDLGGGISLNCWVREGLSENGPFELTPG